MNRTERRFSDMKHHLQSIARDIRRQNASVPFLLEAKQVLNRVFGPDRNHISNIDVNEALDSAIVQLGYASTPISRLRTQEIAQIESAANTLLRYKILIHFPRIEISNSHGTTHTIQDLFVRFFLNVAGMLKDSIQGIRTTGTMAEIQSHYVHSHLPRLDWDQMTFQPFCIGRGPLVEAIEMLGEEFTPINFEFLLHHIGELVSWESLEGVPYISIDTIQRQISNRRIVQPGIDYLPYYQSFLAKLRHCTLEQLLPIIGIPAGDNIEVVQNEALEDFITQVIESTSSLHHETTWAFKTRTGEYCHDDAEVMVTRVDTDRLILKFKNICKYLNISDHEDGREQKKYPNPYITGGICNELSRKLRQYCARRIRDAHELQYHHLRESTTTNQLFM